MTASNATQTTTATWELDPAHSSVEFAVKHMMMTTVRGRFKELSATLTADEEQPEGCCVEVTIKTASIDTGVPDRDAHLRSGDFFDAENYPEIIFKSKRLKGRFGKEGDRFRMIGDLTIRDTQMEVTLDCEFAGRGQDPWGRDRAGFMARGEIDRRGVGPEVEPSDRDGRRARRQQGSD